MSGKKPAEIKKLQGTFRRDREHSSATPAPGIPKCPEHLTDVAKQEFRRVARILNLVGILSRLDGPILAAYAANYARWVEAEEQLGNDALILTAPNGISYPNPLIKVAHQAREAAAKCARDLGLTPHARVALPIPQQRTRGASKLDKYIQDRRELLFGA